MKTVAIIPSRFDSSRLPGKALRPIAGKPMIERLVERVMRAASVDEIVVATTTLDSDEAVVRAADACGARWFRGSPDDVLGRIVGAAQESAADVIVEIMGDSPLVHSSLIDAVVDRFNPEANDFVCSYTATVALPEHDGRLAAFPVGIWVETFLREAMEQCEREFTSSFAREHSTTSLYKNPKRFRLDYLQATGDWQDANRPDLFLAVNTSDDFELVSQVYERLLPLDGNFDTLSIMRACDEILEAKREH